MNKQPEQYKPFPPKDDISIPEYYTIPGDQVLMKTAKDELREAMPTGIGFAGVHKFMNSFLYPFGTTTNWSKDSKEDTKFFSEVKRSFAAEQQTIQALVRNARKYILLDPEVRHVLGDRISFGAPFSRSFLSPSVSNTERTAPCRLQLGIPITGDRNGSKEEVAGSLWILADQDEMTQLKVIVGSQEINVRID